MHWPPLFLPIRKQGGGAMDTNTTDTFFSSIFISIISFLGVVAQILVVKRKY